MSTHLSLTKTHICGHCGKAHSYPAALQYLIFACPDCRTYFQKENEVWQKKGTGSIWEATPISLGMQAVFDGEAYTVVGSASLNTPNGSYDTRWQEYLMTGEKGSRAFLSETEGHWAFLKEMEDIKALNIQSRQIFLQRGQTLYTFKKIHRYNIKCESAAGFFDFPLFEKASAEEAILVPELIVKEKRGQNKSAFLGYYVSPKALKEAFQQDLNLPIRYGTGTAQSFYFNHHFYLILLVAGLAILLLNVVTNVMVKEQKLFEHRVNLKDSLWYNRVVSPSFDISGPVSPVEIKIQCPGLENSWLSFDVALVNEKTQEAFYTEIGLEHYSGVDADGSWTEGKTQDAFTICSVPPGRYTVAFRPYKSSDDIRIVYLTLTRGHAYLANGITCFWVCLVIGASVGLYHLHFEKRRWEGASYPQY